MEQENEGEVVELQAEVDTLEEATQEEQDTIDWKAKYEETKGQLKRAETKLEKQKIEKKVEPIVEKQSKTGELDDAVLDFFELKGYGEEAETEILHNIMKRTGMSHREVLKDEYALAKIASIRKEKEVKDATPSATRRSSGGASNDVDYALAKYEQTGELPKDFALKSQVLNKFIDNKGSSSKPAWHS